METLSRYLLTFLFNSLWQISVIACVAALACRLMRNGPASHRHAVWVAALLLAFVMPLASIRSVERTAGSGFKAPVAPQLSASSASSAIPAVSADLSRRRRATPSLMPRRPPLRWSPFICCFSCSVSSGSCVRGCTR